MAEERVWTADERKLEADQAALWVDALARAAPLQPNEKFTALWLGLRNMGHRMTIPGHSIAIDQIFGELQRDLLATPGHARYFADLVEAERAAFQAGGYRGDDDRHCCWYLRDTLRHLPSPETVGVLGAALDDERDAVRADDDVSDGTPAPSNAILAANTLCDLGIRGAPLPEGKYLGYASTDKLATVRAWFAPIKSGEQPFSFKGKAEEHRFKPDGTWTTTPIANPPDDGPKPQAPKAPVRGHSPPSAGSPPAAESGPSPPWPWLAGGGLAVLAAAWYFLKSRKQPVA